MTAVSIEDVWKYYGDYPALQKITFDVERGECLALLGRNGAGKTTLLRILAGLSRSSKGRITILGQDARDESARRQLSVLGHGIGVYEELSAMENLMLFARLYALPDPSKVATGMAGAHRASPCPRRPGPRIFREACASAWRWRARFCIARLFFARRALHRAGRPRHQGAPGSA